MPTTRRSRQARLGFSLTWWVELDDVVFHYDLNRRAIVSWSRPAGGVSEGPTIWLSHGSETRRRLQTPRAQPGWWLDLDGPYCSTSQRCTGMPQRAVAPACA